MTTPATESDRAPTVHQGLRVDHSDPAALRDAIDAAIDYRGDVTLTLASTDDPVTGYLFDVTPARNGRPATLRLLPADGSPRITIPASDLTAIEFTGRDTALGKSFGTWVRKYLTNKGLDVSAARPSAPA